MRCASSKEFIRSNEKLNNVIEQTRDAEETQSLPFPILTRLMMIEFGTAASKLVPVLNYDEMTITAANIYKQIKGKLG